MLANNAITILMLVFTYALFAIPAVWMFSFVPSRLEARKQRQIAQLASGAALLAEAIGRNQHDSAYLGRLTAQYDAHARALGQLGAAVPSPAASASLQQAA